MCSIHKQESKTRHNVSFCAACANGIWPIYASTYSTHSHTHAHLHTYTEIAILSNDFAAGSQIFSLCVCVFFAFLTLQLTRGNF